MRECKLDQLEAYKKGTPAVVARGLKKTFGEVKALEGVDLQVSAGTIMGMLGPNGSGKTTFVRIMTTLLKQDEGEASVAGYDVIKDADIVRGLIGLAGQYPAVDEILTGKENLQMVGQLYHLGRKQARYRADELLEQFDLTRAVTSGVFSIYLVLGCAFAILGGWALDRYGPRIIILLMGLFTGFSLLLTSQTNSLWQLFITYSLLLSMGTGAMFVVTVVPPVVVPLSKLELPA